MIIEDIFGDFMLFEGYKFGLISQLAIGPVCLFIFNIGSIYGIIFGLIGVIGVTIVDALYVFLAIYGIAEFVKKEEIKRYLRYGGSLVVILLGIKFIYDGLWANFATPTLTEYQSTKIFIESIIFTASNPLTIFFWVGVLSSKLTKGNIIKKDAYLFGIGVVFSTLTFLTGIVIIGTITKTFLPFFMVTLLNIGVGLLLIGFGIKYLIKPNE